MLFYPATLPLSRQTLTYTAGVIRAACTSQQPTSLEQIIGREGGGSGSDTPSYFRGFAVVRA